MDDERFRTLDAIAVRTLADLLIDSNYFKGLDVEKIAGKILTLSATGMGGVFRGLIYPFSFSRSFDNLSLTMFDLSGEDNYEVLRAYKEDLAFDLKNQKDGFYKLVKHELLVGYYAYLCIDGFTITGTKTPDN